MVIYQDVEKVPKRLLQSVWVRWEDFASAIHATPEEAWERFGELFVFSTAVDEASGTYLDGWTIPDHGYRVYVQGSVVAQAMCLYLNGFSRVELSERRPKEIMVVAPFMPSKTGEVMIEQRPNGKFLVARR